MHRFWLISFSLCCCLLAVAVWTSSQSQLPVMAEANEAAETAAYLKALQASWTDQAAPSGSDLSPATQPAAPVTELPSLAEQPLPALVPTLAEPLPEIAPPEHDSRTRLAIGSTTMARAARVSGETTPRMAATRRHAEESRVSIMQRPAPFAAGRDPAGSANSNAENWELTAQELQVASAHLSYGKVLARKGATASARSEFLNALAVVAQSRDLRLGGKDHMTALNEAILAMAEAEDFFAKPGNSHLDADVATVAAGHLSRVLDPAVASQTSRAQAISDYQVEARRKLQEACGRNWLASETLYALGRLHNLLGLADPAQQPRELSKAVTFHQAALTADSNNFASANELGVLLARQGQLEAAKRLLIHSVTLSPRRETWTNLATVHHRLGETELAQLAANEANQLLDQTAKSNASPLIRLVAPAEFEALPSEQDYGPAERTVESSSAAPKPPLR